MTPEQFVYWLQGFIEMENPTTLDLRQTKIIKDHLNLVFHKETPNREELTRAARIKRSLEPVIIKVVKKVKLNC